jgi:hypothetical protein
LAFLRSLLVLMLVAAGIVAPASAQAGDELIYTVKRGDTLIDLARDYMTREAHYRFVQRANRIANPLAIPVGTRLKISRGLLKFVPGEAKALSVRGNVTISSRGASHSLTNGAALAEGTTIQTGASSFATLVLDNGSRVSLPSNSRLHISRLRRYKIDSSLDYDFDLTKGGVRSTVTPMKAANDQYRMRSPKAVSAVRGTEFQSRYDETAGTDFAEVTEGALAVGLPNGSESPLPAGSGLVVDKSGMSSIETLLPAVEWPDAGKLQREGSVLFNIPTIAAARGARVSLSSDAGFVDQLADTTTSAGSAEFTEIPDGNYFVRIRPVSQSGVEGIPATFAFKRRLNSISASAAADPLGYKFKWASAGRGNFRYHFQLFRGGKDGLPVIDQRGLEQTEITLSDLPSGDYYWRVASVQYLDGEVNSNWTEFEKIGVTG